MKIAVIGAGIFGISSAIELAEIHQVEVFERNNGILQSASGSNQYRVHRGYHYPRSQDTVEEIIKSEKSFKQVFSEAILTHFEHYYCIAKENSLTSAKQFVDFCNKFGLEFSYSEISLVNKNSIDLCIVVKESVYDPEKLKKICLQKLREKNVKIHLNTEANEKIFEKFDRVIICTYANINNLLRKFPHKQKDYQFELCEKPVVKLPDSFANKSIVIMDGPFMCIDPLGDTGLHLLCNVVHEVHHTNIGKYHNVDKKYASLIDNGIIDNPSYTNFAKFIESAVKFIPEIKTAKHIGSMFTIRAVPPRVEDTDARPTIVDTINEKIIVIFSGKITTCINAAQEVKQLIDKN
jgi:hypothetical protein